MYGDYTESGSIYAHDIIGRMPPETENESVLVSNNKVIAYNEKLWIADIEYTPAQIQCRESCLSFGL